MTDTTTAFSAHLAALVVASGMTQTAFAEAIDVGQPVASRYLNGKKLPGQPTIRRIALVLGADPDDLLWRAGIVPDSLIAAGLFNIDVSVVRRFVAKGRA